MIFGMTYGLAGLLAFASALLLPVLLMGLASRRHVQERDAESERNLIERAETNFETVGITRLPPPLPTDEPEMPQRLAA